MFFEDYLNVFTLHNMFPDHKESAKAELDEIPAVMDIPDDSEISINLTPDMIWAALKVIENKA